jgi:hypothetical protein
MTRPLRIEFPGAIYHLTARGNGRAAIFLDDFDREVFLSVFGDVVGMGTGTFYFSLLFSHFLTAFCGNVRSCQELHDLPSEGFVTTF